VAYRAEIEIGVKGQEAIGRLQKQLDGTLYKINELNRTSVFRTGNVTQNIDKYTKQVSLAAKALDLAALGTQQETRAINNYVTAVGRANTARERQLNLIDTEIKKRQELERVQKLTAAGIFETTRFKEPIGPALPPSVGSTKGFPSSPVGGGINMPGSPIARAAQRKTFENVALGAGFPLLFGGGPGAVLGGAAGGLIPGSPMLSVVTSALGTQLDNLIKSTTDFAKSLRVGGDAAGYLEQKLGYLDPTIKNQIQNLQNSGQTAEAAKLAFNKLASEIGQESAAGFLQAGKNAEALQSSFTKLTLSIIASGFAFNKWLEDSKAFKFDDNTLPGPLRPTKVSENEATTPAYKQKTAELQNQVVLLGKQAQLKGIDSKLDVEGYASARRKVAQQEYTNELLKIANQLKTREIGLDQNQLLIRAANLQLAGKLNDIEVDRVKQINENNKQAATQAKALATEQDRAAKAVANIRKEQLSTVLEGLDVQYELDTLYKGEQVTLQQRIKNAQKEFDIRQLILAKEEEAALATAKTPQEEAAVVKLYDLKFKLLQNQVYLQDKLNRNRALELQYTKDIIAIQNKGAVTVAGSTAAADIAGARANLARSMGQTGFDFQQAQLNAEQQTKRNELATRLQEINRMRQEVPNLTGDAQTQLQTQLTNAQALYDIDVKKLDVLFAIEQQQLRVNQVTEQYGGIASAVGDSFSTSFKGIINGSMTAREALAGFFQSVADAFLDMAAQIIAKWITMTILNSVLSLFPGGGTKSLGNANLTDVSKYAGSASDFSIGSFPLAGKAAGGPVMGGTPYIVGEKGPELFMPGRSGTIIPNNALGGGSTNVVVNVDASGNSNVQGDQAQAKQLGVAVSAAVQAELVKQQRPGGLLAGTRR
jgi:hypothetical protein